MKRCSNTPNRVADSKRYARTPLSPNAEDAENADENAENADANCIRPSPPREMRCKSKVLQVTLQAMARNPQNLQVQTSGCAVLCDAARGQVRVHTNARQSSLMHSRPLARPLSLSFALFPFVSISLAHARALFPSRCFAFCHLLFLSFSLVLFFLSFPHGRALASPFLFLFLSFFSSRARGEGVHTHWGFAPQLKRDNRRSECDLQTPFSPCFRAQIFETPDFPPECSRARRERRETPDKHENLADFSAFQKLLLSQFTVHQIFECYISI